MSSALRFYVKHLRIRFFGKWMRYVQEKKRSDQQHKLQTEQALLFFVRRRLTSFLRRWINYVYDVLPQMTEMADSFYEAMLYRIAFLSWKNRYIQIIAMGICADDYYFQIKLPTTSNIFSYWRTIANAQQTAKICAHADHHYMTSLMRIVFHWWYTKFCDMRKLQPRIHKLCSRINYRIMETAIWTLRESYQKLQQQRKDVEEAIKYYAEQKSTSVMRYVIEQGIAFVRAEDARRAKLVAKQAEETYLLDLFRTRRDLLDPASSIFKIQSDNQKAIKEKECDPNVSELVLPNPRPAVHPRKSEATPPSSHKFSTNQNNTGTTETGVRTKSTARPAPIAPRTQSRVVAKVQRSPSVYSQTKQLIEIPNDMSIYSHTEENTQESTLTVEDEKLLTQYMDSYDSIFKEINPLQNKISSIEAEIDSKTAELPLTPYPQTMHLEIISLKMQKEELLVQLERKNAQAETLRSILADYKARLST